MDESCELFRCAPESIGGSGPAGPSWKGFRETVVLLTNTARPSQKLSEQQMYTTSAVTRSEQKTEIVEVVHMIPLNRSLTCQHLDLVPSRRTPHQSCRSFREREGKLQSNSGAAAANKRREARDCPEDPRPESATTNEVPQASVPKR